MPEKHSCTTLIYIDDLLVVNLLTAGMMDRGYNGGGTFQCLAVAMDSRHAATEMA